MADSSRRGFLRNLTIGGAGMSALGMLTANRQVFADELKDIHLADKDAVSLGRTRSEYTLAADLVYLNHASIGTIPKIVQDARRRYLETCESNPWLYMWGGAWIEPWREVRAKSADYIGTDEASVAITHNATEGFNVLAHGLPLGPGDEVLFSTLNHGGASNTFRQQAEVRGYSVRRFDFPIMEADDMAIDDVVALHIDAISDETRLLVIPHIDNAIGLRHPVKEISQAARARGVEWIAVDAAQSVGMIDVNVGEMGIDMLSTSPHKWLQAPKGLGIACFGANMRRVLRPMWVRWGGGWLKEGELFEDYGTRNLPEVLTLGDAIAFQSEIRHAEREARLRELHRVTRELTDAHPRTRWASPRKWSMGGSLYTIQVKDIKSTDLAKSLFEEHGFVVRRFELNDEVQTIRVSPNLFNTEEEINRLFELI